MVGSRDDGFSRFERLTQSVEHVRLKFGKLIQEKNAVVRERNLTRTWSRSTADERRHTGGVMRRPKRTINGQLAAHEFAGERMHHRYFKDFLRLQRRQD